jgi:hypothetical protein
MVHRIATRIVPREAAALTNLRELAASVVTLCLALLVPL